MKIAISGSTGFLGQHLIQTVKDKGWEIIPITRADFKKNDADFQKLVTGTDVIINLAGAPIIKRWTNKHKKLIYSSRIETTKKIADAIKALKDKPALFISTSAIGIYPDEGKHTEQSQEITEGFIGKLCTDWEKEALKISSETRLVIFRIGLVLGKTGGAMKKLLPFFRLGLGGKIGNGKQAFSWIHIKDLIEIFTWVIHNKEVHGVFNLTAPEIVSNNEFTKTLARVLNRPAFLFIPPIALKILYGEGASTLISGQAAVPEKLTDSDYQFKFPGLKDALRDILD